MAAERRFVYVGGADIPRNATHVSVHESVTVIPVMLFYKHRKVVELICHDGVERIEHDAFHSCPRLRRLIIPGVKVIQAGAFQHCVAVTHVECDNVEMIGGFAFSGCISLSSINLPSAKLKFVKAGAFLHCKAIKSVKFGKKFEAIEGIAFGNCASLEQITVPLKNGLISGHSIFQGCKNLSRLDLVEGGMLRETIAALLVEEWMNDMNETIGSINEILPSTSPGKFFTDDTGRKCRVIRDWIFRVLDKIIRYKAQHRFLLSEVATTLQFALPNDIVMNNVIPFLELPQHTFEGEDGEERR